MKMRYIKKPIPVEAFQLGVDEPCEWFTEYVSKNRVTTFYENCENKRIVKAIISTLEGDMSANKGDYIVKGIKDEIYPVKSYIFEKTYEPELIYISNIYEALKKGEEIRNKV